MLEQCRTGVLCLTGTAGERYAQKLHTIVAAEQDGSRSAAVESLRAMRKSKGQMTTGPSKRRPQRGYVVAA